MDYKNIDNVIEKECEFIEKIIKENQMEAAKEVHDITTALAELILARAVAERINH